MITLIIATLTLVAILFLVTQLLKANKNNTLLNLVKDFLVVTLSLGLTVLVIFVAWRLFRIFL
tara:strand:- start:638 stop:826 length:189 start_codon:yes stop_codon:yes gene_type:complete